MSALKGFARLIRIGYRSAIQCAPIKERGFSNEEMVIRYSCRFTFRYVCGTRACVQVTWQRIKNGALHCLYHWKLYSDRVA